MRKICVALIAVMGMVLFGCVHDQCPLQETELRELMPGTSVDLQGIPADVAAEIVRAFADVQRSYPLALANIARVNAQCNEVGSKPYSCDVYAYTYPRTRYSANAVIFVDARLQSLRSVNAQYRRESWTHHHVDAGKKSGMYALTVHELGHVLMANLRLQDDADLIMLYQRHKHDMELGLTLCMNAATNICEFFAEVFVDIVCNGAADPVSKQVQKIIERRMHDSR